MVAGLLISRDQGARRVLRVGNCIPKFNLEGSGPDGIRVSSGSRVEVFKLHLHISPPLCNQGSFVALDYTPTTRLDTSHFGFVASFRSFVARGLKEAPSTC